MILPSGDQRGLGIYFDPVNGRAEGEPFQVTAFDNPSLMVAEAIRVLGSLGAPRVARHSSWIVSGLSETSDSLAPRRRGLQNNPSWRQPGHETRALCDDGMRARNHISLHVYGTSRADQHFQCRADEELPSTLRAAGAPSGDHACLSWPASDAKGSRGD